MVDNVDVTRDAPRLPQNAPDPNVVVPAHVKAASAAADAIHQQAYQQQASVAPPDPTPTTPPVVLLDPTVPVDPKAAERASWTAEQWEHHARSMEGRFKAQQQTIHSLQDNAAQLAQELLQTQAMFQKLQPQQQVKTEPLLTPQDEENFGKDLIDFAKRAALEAVQPELVSLRNQNEQLQKRISNTSATTVWSTLDQQMPNWREINDSPEFIKWLNLPDIYSGNIRKNLLNAAFKAANAARVVAFFQGYLNEASATGSLETLPPNPAAVPLTAPRQAAVPLVALTTPGDARPAVGTPAPMTASPQFITRAQIAQFYHNARLADQGKGPYAGRDADRRNDEAFIQECQRAGRIH